MTADKEPEKILLGKWTEKKIDTLLRESSAIDVAAERINYLSAHFLDTEYEDSTLIGDALTPEVFVINLKGVDCFTCLDYIEAMRLSGSFAEFRENLRNVRYRAGIIAFENRNHFFSDWREHNSDHLEDVTPLVSGGTCRNVHKRLNRKEDGGRYLSGIPVTDRDISYIPADAVNAEVIDRFRTGDYAGIYSTDDGLDVSHVGIVIVKDSTIFLRHASSPVNYGKVVDQDFKKYIADKPGVIILRPRGLGKD